MDREPTSTTKFARPTSRCSKLREAESDACFSQDEVRKTARAYGTEAEFFPDMGHNMMLEPEWQAVAERIDSWLTARGL
jgi:hypothetical protein